MLYPRISLKHKLYPWEMIKEDYWCLSYSSVFVNILSDFNTDGLINTNSTLRSNLVSSSNSATDFEHEMTG